MSLITLLVVLIIFGVLFWVVGFIPMAPPFKTAAYIVLALIFVLWLLGQVGALGNLNLRLN